MQNLKLTRDGAVATVTIDRPEKLNALDAATLDELEAAFRDLRADAGVGAVILTGAGEKAYVAGADIGELARQTPLSGKLTARRGQQLFRAIELFPKPVDGGALPHPPRHFCSSMSSGTSLTCQSCTCTMSGRQSR